MTDNYRVSPLSNWWIMLLSLWNVLWRSVGGSRQGRSSRCTGPPKMVHPGSLHHILPTGTPGQEEEGCTQTDQILFSPPIVCVQWPITVPHSITNPLCPSPNRTPHHHLHSIGLFPGSPRTHRRAHLYASMPTASCGRLNAPSSQFWVSGNRHAPNGPAELVSAASSILC